MNLHSPGSICCNTREHVITVGCRKLALNEETNELPTLEEMPFDVEFDLPDVGLTQFELPNTESLTQTQRGSLPIPQISLNVYNGLLALSQRSDSTMSLQACTAGMPRSDAAKLFYQLLGMHP